MISRTHGQAATPTSFGKEMAVFADRIKKTAEHFAGLPLYGKCNGASGCYATFSLFESDPATAIAKNDDFISSLGLTPIQLTTQIAPADDLASYLHALVRLASILKDASVDFWLYCSQNYLALKVVDEEVGSSTMPHKVNPINFENAEGNLSIAISLASGLATADHHLSAPARPFGLNPDEKYRPRNRLPYRRDRKPGRAACKK